MIKNQEAFERAVREFDKEVMNFFKEKDLKIPFHLAAVWLEVRDILNGKEEESPHDVQL